jgi:phosphoribosylformylglycinamidine synthase
VQRWRVATEPDATRLSLFAAESVVRCRGVAVARVVVDVVLKPEILDPQGQAIVGALGRLGVEGVTSVRQGKHFELDVDDNVQDDAIAKIADTLLSNPVIENYTISRK